jgi:hypothetical protein
LSRSRIGSGKEAVMPSEKPSSRTQAGAPGATPAHGFEHLLGRAAFRLWPELPRAVQELLFDTAVGADSDLANRLAVFLHDHHPRTAHPPRPTQLA